MPRTRIFDHIAVNGERGHFGILHLVMSHLSHVLGRPQKVILILLRGEQQGEFSWSRNVFKAIRYRTFCMHNVINDQAYKIMTNHQIPLSSNSTS